MGSAAGAATVTGNGNGNGRGNGTGSGWSGSSWSAGAHPGSMRAGTGRGRANRGSGAGAGRSGSSAHAGSVPAAVPGATISSEVAAELAYMVQEEQLARDIYALAKAEYSDRIFVNIGRAESAHMAELRLILDRYDVADPTAKAKAGVYADDGLQALYDSLAAQVAVSRDEAIEAGIAVETADIADLKAALGLSAPSDVTTVLNNLLSGSYRHLSAFQRNA